MISRIALLGSAIALGACASVAQATPQDAGNETPPATTEDAAPAMPMDMMDHEGMMEDMPGPDEGVFPSMGHGTADMIGLEGESIGSAKLIDGPNGMLIRLELAPGSLEPGCVVVDHPHIASGDAATGIAEVDEHLDHLDDPVAGRRCGQPSPVGSGADRDGIGRDAGPLGQIDARDRTARYDQVADRRIGPVGRIGWRWGSQCRGGRRIRRGRCGCGVGSGNIQVRRGIVSAAPGGEKSDENE